MVDLNDYVCTNPFRYLDVQERDSFICCPSWVKHNRISVYWNDTDEINLADDWYNGELITEIRKSVQNGSYEYCDKKVCPHLSKVLNSGDSEGTSLLSQKEFDKVYRHGKHPEDYAETFLTGPEEIVFGFDRACNLKCPSCRHDTVINLKEDDPAQIKKHNIMQEIDIHFSSSIKRLCITGSGDPVYSRVFREYLQNFDIKKYPNIEDIKLITNANLLNEKMWNSFSAKDVIHTIDISVDAGTRETYENKTRLNGDWDKLCNNIEFIASQPQITTLSVSMVVSQQNYAEMKTFYDVMIDIIKNRAKYDNHLSVDFRRIVYWDTGAYRPEDIRNISVFNKEHPAHDQFLTQLHTVHDLPYVTHNFHELVSQ